MRKYGEFNKYTASGRLNKAIKQLASKLSTLKRNIYGERRIKDDKEVYRSSKERG